jgi:hypothetical protein
LFSQVIIAIFETIGTIIGTFQALNSHPGFRKLHTSFFITYETFYLSSPWGFLALLYDDALASSSIRSIVLAREWNCYC